MKSTESLTKLIITLAVVLVVLILFTLYRQNQFKSVAEEFEEQEPVDKINEEEPVFTGASAEEIEAKLSAMEDDQAGEPAMTSEEIELRLKAMEEEQSGEPAVSPEEINAKLETLE